ncbi:MAG: pyridoxamine 5'-phosphate oxidase family protein [Pseudomonadota bacterium]
MPHRYHELLFSPAIKAVQTAAGSRDMLAAAEGGEVHRDQFGPNEATFIALRDSFYMASVGETGWPYVQHRGGPQGFVRVFDQNTIGFADFAGNRQYVSVGNILANDRVSLFFMDYPNRRRLKLLGRAKFIGDDTPDVVAELAVPGYRARVERGVLIKVEAFDWNCPQHITPRQVDDESAAEIAALRKRVVALEAELGDRDQTTTR